MVAKTKLCILIVLLSEVFCDKGFAEFHTQNANLVGITKNDKEDIYRPCKFEDWSCVRKFLAVNSQCSPSEGRAPDPLILEVDTVYLPLVNVTVVLKNVQTSGLNDVKITEFYANKNTGNVVIALAVRGMSERSSETILKYLRTGREPVIMKDYTTATYELITFTAVIPKVPHLELAKADIHADIPDGKPVNVVGPQAYGSLDTPIGKTFEAITLDMPIIIREAFLLKSNYLTKTIIQNKICNFGI